ncbi:transcription elongation factor GreA [Spelaeicoccus albus]|uniref:Transcription elongation factor GreA n=1 Tax=Spelaeicoccus albus TaxID=1280376 RepID=A0A7Z0D339_9MICO|nr:transcription elongation factor GreA [Spelaeicoccus albus]NYI67992.1 transcription elongation factor GreA [Spelaeicoccus albus]
MTEAQSEVTWLSQEAYDRLQAEHEYLTGEGRMEIAKKIEAAREEGDLKENGGYHAAREEQGKREARVRQLETLLRHAQVGASPADDGVVEPGMVVTAKVNGNKMTFLLGNRELAGDSELDVFSEKSPLGEAVNGLKSGKSTKYRAPNGKDIPVEIVEAKPYED